MTACGLGQLVLPKEWLIADHQSLYGDVQSGEQWADIRDLAEWAQALGDPEILTGVETTATLTEALATTGRHPRPNDLKAQP